MILATFPPFSPGTVIHATPVDPCAGCQHKAIVGKAPGAWAYCTLHVTPRSKCASYESAPGATVKTDRLAGGLQCK